ncbi:formate-dependent phosphoribosylglycinamide formyltransferase [Bifidobacterium sp. SMB2]|uniref:Formate-dependent phosphoribosylglycinamide formyltransferase n=2 Tax=Bifidobacterium TaxID=1678 RepID=A0ABX0CDI8_9BIFI|nr:formate-dependent phosphoribosylglycinamide formyltransferase [Bifidobacterium sp. SMB2]NEH10608.1 formate-dependent phosphoribosylglycinamide formyltransferase [Bifidobacterium saimiriisciurei]NEH10609.1 formate-dependent phosphoribosylglycinamide formyltransferase [Bifidobacterium saimiriisciurei]
MLYQLSYSHHVVSVQRTERAQQVNTIHDFQRLSHRRVAKVPGVLRHRRKPSRTSVSTVISIGMALTGSADATIKGMSKSENPTVNSSNPPAATDRPLGDLRGNRTCALLLGSGELGKEIVIELMRLGVWVCAADSYEGAPAQYVANEARVLDMAKADELNALIADVRPDIIIPEVEAIATAELSKAAEAGVQVVPSCQIAQICMDRERLRRLAAEDLGLPTSPYRFAESEEELAEGAAAVGFPCVVKPVMSSSGHGQSVMRGADDVARAWDIAQNEGRTAKEHKVSRVVVEAFVPMDYELTVLTVSSSSGIVTCDPIGQRQEDGDYRESWQCASITDDVRRQAAEIATTMVSGLVELARRHGETGWGVYGVELFVLKDGRVLFNEVSPRPHDTGMVTMISQHLSEFALHARAVLGVPVSGRSVALRDPDMVSASHAIVVSGKGEVTFRHLAEALSQPDTDVRIFGKPGVNGHRRMAVALAAAPTEEEARRKAADVARRLEVTVGERG